MVLREENLQTQEFFSATGNVQKTIDGIPLSKLILSGQIAAMTQDDRKLLKNVVRNAQKD